MDLTLHLLGVNASTHQLSDIFRWPSNLCKAQTSLDALQELPRDLVSHDMTLVTLMQFLSSTTLVDTNHGNSNWPRCLSNTQTQISIVGVDISPLLSCFDDLDNRFQDPLVYIAFLKFSK
jgi:hypothetical protein